MTEDRNDHSSQEDFPILYERDRMLFRDAEILPAAPVLVLSQEGRRLSPCFRNGHVRRLLRDGLAVVEKAYPFTIRLLYSKRRCSPLRSDLRIEDVF
mgnify:CR=1 FL=1